MTSFFIKAPAAFLAIALMLGIGISATLPFPASLWGYSLALAGVFIIVSVFLRPRRPSLCWYTLILLIASLGGYRYQADTKPPQGLARFSPGSISLRGIVTSDPDSASRHLRFRLSPDSTPGVGIRVLLRGSAVPVSYGDWVEVKGELRVPPGQRNPGGFDFRAYLKRNGIYFLLSAKGDRSISILASRRGNPLVQGVVMPLRRRIHRDFGATLTGEPEALLKGLILGERSDLPHQTLAAFADAGTVHILAVSGFNVGLVVLIFFLFFRSIGFSPTLANLLLVPLLIVYAGLTDFTPSVVRATIMAVIFIIGFLLERESSPYNLLGLAALVILLLWPQALFDLSFSLSFAATFGIIFLAPRFYGLFPEQVRKSRWGSWLFLPLFVTLSAQMFSTPLILQSFYRLSLVSPLANLIILPLVTLATALGFSQILSGFLNFSLSRIFAAANWLVLKGILASTSFFAHLPYASLRFGLPIVSLLGFYGLLLSAPWIRKRWEARVSVALAALLVLVPLVWRAARPHSNTLMVTFLDVGQGDAAFLEFPNGRAVLLDGGGAFEGWNAGEWDVAPFLWDRGRNRLDAVVASHLQQDHVGGLPFILDHFPVGRVIESEAPCSTDAGASLHRTILARSLARSLLAEGDTLLFDPQVSVRALSPSNGIVTSFINSPKLDPNFSSLVLKVTYGGISFLFCGDLPSEADSMLLNRGFDLCATALKVPHHGSANASSQDFVEAVCPRVAVFSLAARNLYGFPRSSVVERYRNAGAIVLRTDEQGAISLWTDGRKLWFFTQAHPETRELLMSDSAKGSGFGVDKRP
jgi:competence protein ComEC